MKCDIIIPIWDQLDFTRDCIASIESNTKWPFRLILIDNGSNSETKAYLNSLPGSMTNVEVKLIKNKENLGFVKAVNQGLRVSTAPYICVMNNDTLATDGWLAEMVRVANADPSIGLVNPSSNNLGQNPGSLELVKYAWTLKRFSGEHIEMGACLGFSMLFKREIFEEVGFFDEVYGVGLFDDTDYSRRVEKLGYVCVRAKGSYIYHRVSKSFVRKRNFQVMFRKNEQIFNKRWGKPKRLLYIISKDHKKLHEWIKKESLKKARFGNWIWFFLKQDAPFTIKEHSNIRIFNLPAVLFGQNCMLRVMKRRKKFDSIYVDEEGILENLESKKKYHNADVMLMGG